MFLLFFIQFQFAGSHIEHCRSCSRSTSTHTTLYQYLSHLTSLEARTPAPFKVHSTMEQMAFDGKSAVGFEV